MPEEKIATVFLANANGVDSEEWAQRLYDIVAPAILAAVKEPGKGKAPDPDSAPTPAPTPASPGPARSPFLPWEDGLAMLDLPTSNPVKELDKLKKTGEHTFRRIRKDETLAKTIVFEMGPDGRAVRYRQHSNVYSRLR